MHPLAQGILDGEVRAAARAMRLVDDRQPGAVELLKDIFPHTGKAYVIGVTGNPGSGKSTLCDRLIEIVRKEGKRVGVIAVDPTSPYSGGAILGDRIRMNRHATDPGVFIRSVATRGHLGGLSRSARDLVRVLDAFGSDVILVETVGVGQDELEVTRTAHTTLVVVAPGLGDDVQAIKAGLMECADVFAVNKADRDGADATIRDLQLMIALGGESMVAAGRQRGHVTHGADEPLHAKAPPPESWTPPIVRCVALRNEGVAELHDALGRHHAWLSETEAGRARRRQRLAEEVRETLREALIDAATDTLQAELEQAVLAVERKELDPYTATESLIGLFRTR
ncbi:MAG TPA: methylmalonyl Co-A mutase-associated GTPase MeaB [Polyangiaceae bacterium]|nr:methylmalonyl Co-A mutase-associated GTPase MeaB [Polyangiaceae bacterium]